jgi:hypothetical protein
VSDRHIVFVLVVVGEITPITAEVARQIGESVFVSLGECRKRRRRCDNLAAGKLWYTVPLSVSLSLIASPDREKLKREKNERRDDPNQ